MVPVVPEDNVLLTLPFGGAVLKSLGAQPEEVNAILESKRKDVLSGRGLAETEQEAALLQLGIMPSEGEKERKGKEAAMDIEIAGNASKETDDPSSDDGEEVKGYVEAARIEEIKEKSPMVAKVIEANILAADTKEEATVSLDGMGEVAVAIEAMAGDIAPDKDDRDD